jgi:agmatine deiminase
MHGQCHTTLIAFSGAEKNSSTKLQSESSARLSLMMMTMTTPPTSFFMPAEWAPHDACLMQYPSNPYTFRLPLAQDQFLHIAKAIATEGKEPVIIFCPTEEQAQSVQQHIHQHYLLHDSDATIVTCVCPSDDTWARDMAPTFVLSSRSSSQIQTPQRVGIDWNFNAWGQKYPHFEQDALVAERMCQQLKDILHYPIAECRKVPIILEGGSIHVDGEGTLLTTEQCLLNPNRNPTKTRTDLELILCETLHVQKILWLPHGVDGDEDTDGHIDNFCCFGKPGHVILSWTDDDTKDAVNYSRCRAALQLLEQEKDAQGRSLTIHKLYLPPPIVSTSTIDQC